MNRITSFMLFNQFSKSMSHNLSSLSTVQEQLSSGKKITQPSDDVVALRGAMAYKVSINNLEQYDRNLDEGISRLSMTESTISSSTNILNRVRELAVSESNDTATSDTRLVTAFEVRNLFNEMLDLSNTQLKDKYIFSGYMSNTQSFSAAGAYQGDSNDVDVYIGDGITSKTNVTGDDVFFDTTKLVTDNITTPMSGTLTITSGGNPVTLPIKDGATNATPEEIRDTINAPMSGYYAPAASIGAGKLTFQVGSRAVQTIDVDAATLNDTVSTLATYINSNVTGIEARVATDTVTLEERLYFRPTTTGEGFSIDVDDDDGNDINTSGLSALLHTDVKSNLTSNALGIEALVLDDGTNKRMILESVPASQTFSITVADGDGGNADNTGLSMLHHTTATSNMTGNTISFFSVMQHFDNALSTNNREGIQSSILFMDGAINSVVKTIADVGSRLKYFEDQQVRGDDNGLLFKKSLSVLEDADIAASAMELAKIQTTLEAMRISAVRNLTQSLFDFMG